MNYYEELGVSPNATVEEIRQAYKTLARVIHPDAHPDPASKAAAEIRMQRLNAVAATLTNPEGRASYDASIGAIQRLSPIEVHSVPPGPNERPVQEGFFQRHILWFATGAVATGAALWVYLAGESHLTQIQLSPASRVAAAEPAEKPGNPPAVLRRSAAVESTREPGFAGNWLYIAAAQMRSAPSNTPIVESAQFYLAEQSGNLFGRYSARYGPGGPAQAEVNFTLNGRAPLSGPAVLAFSSADGSSGTVQLSLQTPTSLQLDWWTTDITGIGPRSGSLVLTRVR